MCEYEKNLQKKYFYIWDLVNMSRPGWDRYFLDLCLAVAKRATCDRGRSGCVIVKDKRIMTAGYVGSPKGLPHCDEVGHDIRKVFDDCENVTKHCVRTLHAEQNAILQAARFGITLEGSTLYCKMTPCRVCAMMITNAGIKRVVCEKRYHADYDSIEIFKKAGIELLVITNKIEEYENQ
jgi:dCMP deaminase